MNFFLAALSITQTILGLVRGFAYKIYTSPNALGTIHKGRLLKGVGRWVHQKEIY